MGKMSPVLYEIRSLIAEIKSLDKTVFPIEIPDDGIYDKPISSFFKYRCKWKYITNYRNGYLQTHPRLYQENGNYIDGSCGCPISDFKDSTRKYVSNVLREIRDKLKNRNMN